MVLVLILFVMMKMGFYRRYALSEREDVLARTSESAEIIGPPDLQ